MGSELAIELKFSLSIIPHHHNKTQQFQCIIHIGSFKNVSFLLEIFEKCTIWEKKPTVISTRSVTPKKAWTNSCIKNEQ